MQKNENGVIWKMYLDKRNIWNLVQSISILWNSNFWEKIWKYIWTKWCYSR